MKRCVLCKSTAKVYCESDMASLCWSCDAKVHSANFLVARHSRSLLCQLCQSPTIWTASGDKLCPSTASICAKCVVEDISDDEDNGEEKVGGNDEYDGGVYADKLELEVSVNEIDNHVAPSSSTPLPPATSSSTSGDLSISDGGVSMKRKRQNVVDLNLTSEDDFDCSSANTNHLTPSSPIPEQDETTSFQSSSDSTAGKLKRIRQRNKISGDYMSSPVNCTSKSTRIAEFDLNSMP
ncbi:hypothetical protein Lser_V15G40403 [Lactuca serriola]